jgi:hypothetical protein
VDSETEQRQRDGMHHLVVPPNADVHELFGIIWSEMKFNIFAQRDIRDLDGVIE